MIFRIINWLMEGTVFIMGASYFTMKTETQPWLAGLILCLFGFVFYFLNAFLINYYIKKNMPEALNDGMWEATAGLGIVPKWVSYIGLSAIPAFGAALVWFYLYYFSS
jgi:hypothetical protein